MDQSKMGGLYHASFRSLRPTPGEGIGFSSLRRSFAGLVCGLFARGLL